MFCQIFECSSTYLLPKEMLDGPLKENIWDGIMGQLLSLYIHLEDHSLKLTDGASVLELGFDKSSLDF